MNMSRKHFGLLLVIALAVMVGFAGVGVAEESKGKLQAVLEDDQTFTFVDNAGAEHTMQLEVSASVLINDRESKLSDLNDGDEITVTWQERDGQKIATMVRCNRE